MKVDDTVILAPTSSTAAQTYYNEEAFHYDDVATQHAVLGAHDAAREHGNTEMTVQEIEIPSTGPLPMSDKKQYQQLVIIPDQRGILLFFIFAFKVYLKCLNI